MTEMLHQILLDGDGLLVFKLRENITLASEWNIKKFTNNRFQNIKLNENAPPKVSEKTYSAIIKQGF